MTSPEIQFFLTSEAIDIATLSETLVDPRAGARVTFDGRVRNHNEGSEVAQLEYQAYPAMVEKVGQKILAEDVPALFLFQLPKLGVWNAKVQGLWENTPIPSNDVTEVSWTE